HKSCRGMRDGIMHVQYIKLFETNDIYQPAGQRQFVWRKIKQRVVRNRNLVVKQIFRKQVEPCRLIISYKVYLVASIGKALAKLRGYNPASAEGWVTNYSDFHLRCLLINGNETIAGCLCIAQVVCRR